MTSPPLIPVAAAFLVFLALGACEIEQRDQAEAPEIEVEPGALPQLEIEPADVEVRTDTQIVVVPEVQVQPERRDTTPGP